MSDSIIRRPAFLVSASVLIASAAALSAAVAGLKLHLRKLPIEVDRKVHTIPTETYRRIPDAKGPRRGDDTVTVWKQVGRDQTMSKEIVEELGTTNYLSRVYQREVPMPDGKRPALELHLAYYTGMVDTVPHVPERCMVGGGWNIKSSPGVVRLPLDISRWETDSAASTADRTIYRGRLSSGFYARLPQGIDNATLLATEFEKPGTDLRMFSGYFFIANGGMCARAEDVRLLAFDLKSRYAFYLKVQVSSLAGVESADKLAEYGADLLSDLLPEIMLCVPDWIAVERGEYPPGAAGAATDAASPAPDSQPHHTESTK